METTKIPKAELHSHLIGVIDKALLQQVEAEGHTPLVKPDSVIPPRRLGNPGDFQAWLKSVEPYQSAHWHSYLPILKIHADNLSDQGVVYSEITISPKMFAGDLDAALCDLEAFAAQSREIEAGRLQIEYLLVIPRRLPEKAMDRDTRFCIEAHQAGLLAGIAVAGMDYDYPLDRLRPMLTRLKDKGLGIEVHSGEHTGPDEVRAVLDSGFADRIGHGIRAFEDLALVERLAQRRVHLEFCPSSNLQTGVVKAISDLPIAKAREMGVSFSINTDDPGAFGCTLDSEFQLVSEEFGFADRDFAVVFDNAMSAQFADAKLPLAAA